MLKDLMDAAIARSASDRRTVPRCFADQQVVITVEAEKIVVMPARVRDTSARGMRVHHEQPMQPGQTVHILTPAMDLLASVVWTRLIEHGWESGLRTDDARALLLRER